MKNLILRTLTGILYVVLVAGSISFSPYSFGVLFAAATALVTLEFCSIISARGEFQLNSLITTLASMLMFFGFFAWNSGYAQQLLLPGMVFLPYIVTIAYLFISGLYLDRTHALDVWAYTMMSQIYIALPFSLLTCIAFIPYPLGALGVAYVWMYPLAVFLFLWASDTGAYCVGSLLGRKIPYRLFPSISPKKSWVGSIGGGLLAILVAIPVSIFEPSMTIWQWIGFALVVTVFGTWGDLVESQIKRTLGIKDSGNILPGHGGLMDRFDSSLLAIPAAVIYIFTMWMG